MCAVVPIYVVCHRGNDSQLAVKLLKEKLSIKGGGGGGGGGGGDGSKESGDGYTGVVKDIAGGLAEWSAVIDHNFPKY